MPFEERDNVLAHEYDEMLHEAIWAIATRRVPELIGWLRKILPDDIGSD